MLVDEGGEVSLSGAVRPVAYAAARLKEAAKLGFTAAFAPESGRDEPADPALRLTPIAALADLVAHIAARGEPRERRDHRIAK